MKIKSLIFIVFIAAQTFCSEQSSISKDTLHTISANDRDNNQILMAQWESKPLKNQKDAQYLLDIAIENGNRDIEQYLRGKGFVPKPVDITVGSDYNDNEERKTAVNFSHHSSANNKPVFIERKPVLPRIDEKIEEGDVEAPKDNKPDVPKQPGPVIRPAATGWGWKRVFLAIGAISIIGSIILSYFGQTKDQELETEE